VTVTLVDALHGTRVSDAKVTMIPAGQSEGQTGFTNGDGAVTITAAWGGFRQQSTPVHSLADDGRAQLPADHG
jgi:hypothetical protein